MKKEVKPIKNVTKKTTAVAKRDAKPVAPVSFTVDIPKKDIPELVKMDAAGLFCEAAKHICEFGKVFPAQERYRFLEVAESCVAIAKCLYAVQEDYKKMADKGGKGKKPAGGSTKAEFTDAEQKKIASMRKKGASIKAIAKAIHRSDKKVAIAVKLFDKVCAKK